VERSLLQRGVYALSGKIGFGKIFPLMGAALGAALVAVWAHQGAEPILPDSRAPSAEGKPSFQPEDSNRFYLPVAGRRYIYSFERRIAFEGQLAGAALPNLGYTGELYVDVLRADARSFEALISQRVKEAGNKLSPPVRVEVDARGDELSLFTGASLTEDEQGHVAVLKDLVALWLFPLRSDTVGPFEARFETLPSGEAEKKTKISYHAKGANVPEVLASLHLLRWNNAIHLPGEISGKEQTRLGASGTSALTASSVYKLEFRSFENSPPHSRELLASLAAASPLALQAKPSLDRHPDYAKLNWSEIMSRLRGLERLDGGQQLEAFGDLLKYLRMHPGKTSELAALLRDPRLLAIGMQSPLFKTLVGALATLGTPEALAALREAYDDPALAREGRTTILASLTTTQAPLDSPTRDFLARKMVSETDGHLAQSAAFALGSSLQTSPSDAQSARSIAQIEAAWASQASSAATNLGPRLALLDVMGNSGRPEFFLQVRGVIESDADLKLRARAVFALRFMTNSDATAQLVQRLQDPAPELREAAANALGHAEWKEAFRAPLGVCAAAESVERVRDSCRRTLDNHPAVAGN
jgi:hypothetical protein